jgi:hypothetical protein
MFHGSEKTQSAINFVVAEVLKNPDQLGKIKGFILRYLLEPSEEDLLPLCHYFLIFALQKEGELLPGNEVETQLSELSSLFLREMPSQIRPIRKEIFRYLLHGVD